MSAPGLRTPEGNRRPPAADVTPGPLKWPASQSPRQVPVPTSTPTKRPAPTRPDPVNPAQPEEEPEEEQHPGAEVQAHVALPLAIYCRRGGRSGPSFENHLRFANAVLPRSSWTLATRFRSKVSDRQVLLGWNGAKCALEVRLHEDGNLEYQEVYDVSVNGKRQRQFSADPVLTLTDNQWHTLGVVRHSSGDVLLTVDGRLVGKGSVEAELPADLFDTARTASTFQAWNNWVLHGDLGPLLIFNTALTITQLSKFDVQHRSIEEREATRREEEAREAARKAEEVALKAKEEAAQKAKAEADKKEEVLRKAKEEAAEKAKEAADKKEERFHREREKLKQELEFERSVSRQAMCCLFQAQAQQPLQHPGWPGTGAAPAAVVLPLQALPPASAWPGPAGPVAFRPSAFGPAPPAGPLPAGPLPPQARPQLPPAASGGGVPAAFRPAAFGRAAVRPHARPRLLSPASAGGGPAPFRPSALAPAASEVPAAPGAAAAALGGGRGPTPFRPSGLGPLPSAGPGGGGGPAPFRPSALGPAPSAGSAPPGRPAPPPEGGPATPASPLETAPADLLAARSGAAGQPAPAAAVSTGVPSRPPQLGQSLVPRPPRVPPPPDVLLRRTGKMMPAPQLPEDETGGRCAERPPPTGARGGATTVEREAAPKPSPPRDAPAPAAETREAANPRARSRSRSHQRAQPPEPRPTSAWPTTPPRGSRPPATPQRARRQPASWEEGEISDWEDDEEVWGADQWQARRSEGRYKQAAWEDEEEDESDDESRHPEEWDRAEDWASNASSSACKMDKDNVKVVPVRLVRYSQGSISGHFQNGRPLASLLEQLKSGAVDAMRDDFLALDAVLIGKIYVSRNNRRLYSLKQYQESVNHEVSMRLKVDPCPSQSLIRRLRKFTGKGVGKAVAVRHNWTKASGRCKDTNDGKKKASSRGRKPKGAKARSSWSSGRWDSGWKHGKDGHWERTWKEQDGAGGREAAGAKEEADDASDSDWGEWNSKCNAASDEKHESDSWGAWKSHGSGN